MTRLDLIWPKHHLFPYERRFGMVEASALLAPKAIVEREDGVSLDTGRATSARQLTYFHTFQRRGRLPEPTLQYLIESETTGARRQSTRYSVHGLHEYKGKFNPQVARALLNSSGLSRGAGVLDPFCGSGTTLVECAHAGFRAVGTDANPLAVLIANAKLAALRCDPDQLEVSATDAVTAAAKKRAMPRRGPAGAYLTAWFEHGVLQKLEALRHAIDACRQELRAILLVAASNLLREFSLQEPADLRIRKRISPHSTRDLYEAFIDEVRALVSNLRVLRRYVAPQARDVLAAHRDARTLSRSQHKKFDAAITSPPYAMALPYIDTQRLSLVWLDLMPPTSLGAAQATLVGSREFHGETRRMWDQRLRDNADALPQRHTALARRLRRVVSRHDGFRRQAVPALLYRYFVGMRDSFLGVRSRLHRDAPFFLIVGHNHTVLGGTRIDIETPALLAELAAQGGFAVERRQHLDTYQRYGLHQRNAIGHEELLTLRAQ